MAENTGTTPPRPGGTSPEEGPPQPASSPRPRLRTLLRDRTHWTTLVVLPLLGAIAFWAVQGSWGWIRDKVFGPPGLTAYTSGPTACTPALLPLVLQTKNARAIVVTGVRAEVLPGGEAVQDEEKPAAENCAGSAHQPVFDVRLDRTPALAVPTVENPEPDRTDFPFTLSADQPKQLNLRIHPGGREVRFTVTVEWVADGEYGRVTLDNDRDRDPLTDGGGYRAGA
ncbi:hypothetical protein [Streptomyces clavuligerus]|uniref:Uncharacterized protein n=1 Tax=Streptomyces clavuligerus TaxID=1901 RepID=B5GLP5_STRCL|nr:hypothetical protein [Streptomyces clavuligerus]EDY47241.1 hypothetical protein SSCG_00269 [Streptomyces clavuligerus]EFG04906.1 Hypothetical protein SCLAV_p1424 [Streptomyces clavuligerus]MBY6306655.1 hypothetical protein [Streptomyces clavuligerus]QCS10738.1 hypothetical protein CRV15_35040 [Streptomyces clavuligerus]QPJ97226.1 hypothetical protein GE265_29440 [Streptomyces clavuligerus]